MLASKNKHTLNSNRATTDYNKIVAKYSQAMPMTGRLVRALQPQKVEQLIPAMRVEEEPPKMKRQRKPRDFSLLDRGINVEEEPMVKQPQQDDGDDFADFVDDYDYGPRKFDKVVLVDLIFMVVLIQRIKRSFSDPKRKPGKQELDFIRV